jgi:hypothetical protein
MKTSALLPLLVAAWALASPLVDSATTDTASEGQQKASVAAQDAAAAAEKNRADWCQREYVSPKDCDEWVANQLARRAARKADEKKRREERQADERSTGGSAGTDNADATSAKNAKEASNDTSQTVSFAVGGNLLDNLPIVCMVSLLASASLGMLAHTAYLAMQRRHFRQEAALLNDPSLV